MSEPIRTLVAIDQYDDGTLLGRVTEASQRVTRQTRKLQFDAWNKPLIDAVTLGEYGGWLRSGLSSHPDIDIVLKGLTTVPANAVTNLHFDINGTVAEAMRWEILGDLSGGHLALGNSPRMGRIAYETSTPSLGRQAFPERLRMVAFLSAARISAQTEFNNLRAALEFAARVGLLVDATFYVGEPALQKANVASTPRLTVLPIPGDPLSLQDAMARQPAHLVHVFCHGRSEPEQLLEFATTPDWLGGATEGSAHFAIDRMLASGALKSAFAVVFNCCDGGKPTNALNSMAYRAVAAAGVPASIGMGAPIAGAAAAIFSGAFYSALFSQLATLKETPGPQTVEICAATTEGRLELHRQLAGAGVICTSWALPIVYLHPDPFILEVGAPTLTEAAAAKLATVTGYLKNLSPDAPPEMRKAIWALFDSDPVVPPAFRPNLAGEYPVAGTKKGEV